ncbi:C-terminal processing protease CtpA/Prc [Virgibacillus natechei]|uniref:C-terminal processing protease CtpA/Prc n=1 Tax=Virgibacillus natechei TaxID=1216297 RepID=A0ABS4IDG0_9BACI|nr:S41 family peptidase [Virgibacillus natechei]MBP1968376.1 C-terminal processing protease CtpA/Prc [Virgibacillus natechei]UZD13505.1 S41 family peptidase [Virgibacillus natechei]
MYAEIFNEVVSITHYDYAGCLDKKGWDNPEKYRNKIQKLEEQKELTPAWFTEMVQDYLLDFKDRHMYFRLSESGKHKQYNGGFKVRRYEDRLYVTSVGKENRLQVGDALISLNTIPIVDLVAKHKRELMESTAEREKWGPVINSYTYCEVVNANGDTKEMRLGKYEKEAYVSEYSIKTIDEDMILMTLSDFDNLDSIPALVKNYEKELASAENLIIDVRMNLGGSGSAFEALLPYIFEAGTTIVDLNEDYAMKYNCTYRNYRLTKELIGNFLKKTNDNDLQNYANNFLREFEKNKGKGFAALNEEEGTRTIEGKEHPKNIVVLSDVDCGSAGEVFVDICKKSPKVTVIGRPTAGVNDYTNLTIMEWEGLFKLYYPTARLDKVDAGEGTTGLGIKPDIYIPWTPEHLEEDVDVCESMLHLCRS